MSYVPHNLRPKDRTDYVPVGFKVKHLAAKRAWSGSVTFPLKGGMTGGASGSTRGVSGGNGMGIVPKAFVNHA